MTSTQPFRLLRAELWDQEEVEVDVDVAPLAGKGSWTTLVTGRNGSGKSRLLSAIAGAFDALDGRHIRNRQPIVVEYRLGERECAFRIDGTKVIAYLDGRKVEAEELPRPGAVVAATASAFDKFHLPREARFLDPNLTESSYRYLGLKDGRGRVSARAGIFRALEQLFDVSDENQYRRQRVADVFRYLGYRPTVEVTYTWTIRGKDLAKESGTDSTRAVERYLENAKSRGIGAARAAIPKYFFEGARVARELAASVDLLLGFSNGREVRLVADYRQLNSGGEDQLRMARQLTRAGIIQMTEVTLWRETSGLRVEITDASSGELSLVVTLLGIASSIEDGSLILIDEPEISLHPQWQSEYLGRLTEAFSDFGGCHFIIATHSPTLVAGASHELTNIVNLERPAAATSEPSSGRSVDEVLFSILGVVTKNSLHLRDLLVAALRGAEDGELALAKYDQEMAALQAARPELPSDDPAGELIDSLVRIRTQLAEKTVS
ncbi:AAA family ATPase [Arthrobacter antibioticus]|uniref:AAA family ATPase n=1 Tax=Arthrobacter sp. H35-MC1 TaxID=3046203 RepID=UPI0024B9E7E9|nr:ATP-binding protein [Arthrobacter sp. H35-MC1]MDJ0318371.1 ATP-binding protein [Arthrobacter sp. H35-MC1]